MVLIEKESLYKSICKIGIRFLEFDSLSLWRDFPHS